MIYRFTIYMIFMIHVIYVNIKLGYFSRKFKDVIICNVYLIALRYNYMPLSKLFPCKVYLLDFREPYNH